MIQTQEIGEKPYFRPDLGTLGPNSGSQIIVVVVVVENLASSFSRYYGQPSSCTISEKTNDPVLRKFSDAQTDGQINGQE